MILSTFLKVTLFPFNVVVFTICERVVFAGKDTDQNLEILR